MLGTGVERSMLLVNTLYLLIIFYNFIRVNILKRIYYISTFCLLSLLKTVAY